MSYFYGKAVMNLDNLTEKLNRRKHSKQRIAVGEYDLESIHSSRHRRKHSSSNKGLLRTKAVSNNVLEAKCENDQTLSPKCKTRKHLHKEIERLMQENRLLSVKLEETSANLASRNTVAEVNDKDSLIVKVRNKCHKLEKSYYEVQADRDKLNAFLKQRENEYRLLHLHSEHLKCEKSELLIANQNLKTENLQLDEGITLLKNLVYRLNVELERYQDKLRLSDQNFDLQKVLNGDISRAEEIKRVSELWGKVNVHAVGPLLNAYQENLEEKEELVKQYKQEIDIFSGNFKEIVNENEILHKEIENLKAKYSNYAEEMKILEEDAVMIKEQNDLLTKQVSLQRQKLQEIHSVYEQKVESMSQNNNKLHKEYLACMTELSNIRGKYEILHDGYEKQKNNSEKTMPVSVHTAAVDECKRLFEEVKTQYEFEKKKLNARIKLLEEIQPENEKQLITVMAEKNQLKIQIKNVEKSLKHTWHKLEHLQNTIYTVQISRDSFKKQLNNITNYCEDLISKQKKLIAEKDKLTALLWDRENKNENIQYLGNNIAQRTGTLKNHHKCVQKGADEQLATVKKYMKIQDLSVNQMKTEYHRELQRLKQFVKQKDVIWKL